MNIKRGAERTLMYGRETGSQGAAAELLRSGYDIF